MNITVSPMINSNYNKIDNNKAFAYRNNITLRGNLAPLSKDMVSFTGAHQKISDAFEHGIEGNMDRLNRIATTYLDVLESVALRLKEHGVSFDRAYCEMNPVKSPKSCTSKVLRSGTFDLPDGIRSTLYIKEPYDLSILSEHLLPEMRKRGYVLAESEMSIKELEKRGYPLTKEQLALSEAEKRKNTIKVPDIDIRLDDTDIDKMKLDEKLRFGMSSPQKSGYEDMQMRFVRDFDKKKNPIMHELIVLFGPNYAEAKHLESEKVYSTLRKLNELNIKFEDNTIGSHSSKAKRYVNLIQQMMRGKISQKLFANAKNKDLYDIDVQMPITFSDEDTGMLNAYMGGLRDRMLSCYSELVKKNSNNSEQLKKIEQNKRKDKATLTLVSKELNSSIEFFRTRENIKP